MKKEEKYDYDTFIRELAQIHVPNDRLAAARMESVRRYRKENRKRLQIWKSMALTCALLMIFVGSIRLSPAFASVVSNIPGLSPLVQMITYDKGVADILDNHYYEELGQTQTKNDLSFTLQGVIADETGMILPYKLSAPMDLSDLVTEKIELRLNGEKVNAQVDFHLYRKEKVFQIEDNLIVTFFDPINYENAQFELYIQFADEKQTEFTFPIALKKEIKKAKIYELNEKMSFEGQNITVKSVSISPIRTGVTIALDPNNEERIFDIDEIRILDEKGEEWSAIGRGTVATGSEEEGITYYMQSNYFREPKKLTLSIGKVMILRKEQDYIDVDFNQNKVVSKPPSIPGLQVKVEKPMVTLNIPTSSYIQGFNGIATDANDYDIDAQSEEINSNNDYLTEQIEILNLNGVANPVRLHFITDELYLEGTQKVDIPLK
ncbi:DUF4179 domain-containing protein [Lysinibacillus xylanilyticus]|uniref:DUF4179 domain-containing protein n=1 Tax=Lysinibacillus xylanilyticus TaxID=582475 RepID=UPI002B251666|nr:DUF4179 domain-containing protein [Lysinibacillus xylanilyticus]MEB2279934.1 DUF4179 domain-containing protein [Lysinibacillus xylanilyticus]